MAEKLDPQVQIHIIDLANAWSGSVLTTDDTSIKKKVERFEQCYKAIIKVVEIK